MNSPISPNCSYLDAIKSITAERKGIDNTPTEQVLANMRFLAVQCFEPAWRACGPLTITSFYRSAALNKAVGGSKTSSHVDGQAIDIEASRIGNSDLFRWCRTHLDFDQLIWEYGDDKEPAWVHVGYRAPSVNRRSVLRIGRVNGKIITTAYDQWSATP